MEKPFAQQLREEFDLTPPMAAWIVITHFFVLACPLVLMWAVNVYGGLLAQPFASPILVQLASAVYIGATAFEVAQNSADRWYLTEATRSVADLFFNSFMTVAFCMYTIGFAGNDWMSIAAIVLTIAYPIAYIKDHPSYRGLNGAVVMLATISLYRVTGDPVAFLFMLGNGIGVFFIVFLIRQRAQILHGFAAFTFGLGFLAWPWGIINAANGTQTSWLFVASVIGAVAAVAAALAPVLAKMQATPRQFGA